MMENISKKSAKPKILVINALIFLFFLAVFSSYESLASGRRDTAPSERGRGQRTYQDTLGTEKSRR